MSVCSCCAGEDTGSPQIGRSACMWKSIPIGRGEILSRAHDPSQFWANQCTTFGHSRIVRASERNSDGTQLSESPVTRMNLPGISGSACLTKDFNHESRTQISSPSWMSLKISGVEIRLSGSREEANTPARVGTGE